MLDNELHLFALHHVSVPRNNAALSDFVEGWCSHSLSSVKGKIPRQLWTLGMQTNAQSDLEISKEMYGVRLIIHIAGFYSSGIGNSFELLTTTFYEVLHYIYTTIKQ